MLRLTNSSQPLPLYLEPQKAHSSLPPHLKQRVILPKVLLPLLLQPALLQINQRTPTLLNPPPPTTKRRQQLLSPQAHKQPLLPRRIRAEPPARLPPIPPLPQPTPPPLPPLLPTKQLLLQPRLLNQSET